MDAVLEADINDGILVGFDDVRSSLQESRARFLAMLSELTREEWQRASRCELWSVHDVARHVRDVAEIHLARLRGDPPVFPSQPMIDGRTEPLRWLERTAGESPYTTLADLERLAAAERDTLAARAKQDSDGTEQGPYGPVHWTILTTHSFWDAWIHERDITQALHRPHGATPTEDRTAALYGLLIASLPADFAGRSLHAVVTLQAPSGRTWMVRLAPRHAVIGAPGADDVSDLTGDLLQVIDALAGRGLDVDTVLIGDPAKREALSWLRPFMVPGTDDGPGATTHSF